MTAHSSKSAHSARNALLYVPVAFALAGLLFLLFNQILASAGADPRWAIVFWPLIYLALLALSARRHQIDQLDILTAFGAAAAALVTSQIVAGLLGERLTTTLTTGQTPAWVSIAMPALQGVVWLLVYLLLAHFWLSRHQLKDREGNGTALAP